MPSDRARISYNPNQLYRSVVMQQGRVTLEADWNEAASIYSEELEQAIRETVGQVGTPDGGYQINQTGVAPAKPFDFTVKAGTLFLNGCRLTLAGDLLFSSQSDWLDTGLDPDWLMPSADKPVTKELVYLLVREQEVSAVEDSALRETALGGPDTAQRTRLIQHVVRMPATVNNCVDALTALLSKYQTLGYQLNPVSRKLKSNATLLASFTLPPSASSNPCEPQATGGYLGSDNQLIRIQISAANTFIWGFDNASFLYRVTIGGDGRTITLQSQPVDAFHQPQSKQAVEILYSAAKLDNGEFIATANGEVQTLISPYNPDTMQLILPAALKGAVSPGTQAYMRVWQEQLTITPGAPIALSGTGLQVTLAVPSGSVFHAGDFWQIAVRPNTSKQLYPDRYLSNTPQPPDGPKLWAAPLALIEWKAGILTVDQSCVPSFDNLVNLSKHQASGCCTISLSPADLSDSNTLQTIINRFAGSNNPVRVCLQPGAYQLSQPLQLNSQFSRLTLEACPGGVTLLAKPGTEANFQQGLVNLSGASGITFQGLTFQMPLVSYSVGPATAVINYWLSLAVRPVDCPRLTIADCAFNFAMPTDASPLVASAIFAAGECIGLRMTGNRFNGVNSQGMPAGFQAGFSIFPGFNSGASINYLSSWLDQALFRENYFDTLSAALLVYGNYGQAFMESNTLRNTLNGFLFLSLPALSYDSNITNVAVDSTVALGASVYSNALYYILANPVLQNAASVFRGLPLPGGYTPTKFINFTLDQSLANDITPIQTLFNNTLTATFAAAKVSTAVAAATVTAAAAPAPAAGTSSAAVTHAPALTEAAMTSSAPLAAAAATEASLPAATVAAAAVQKPLIQAVQGQNITLLTSHPVASIQPLPATLQTLNANFNLIDKRAFQFIPVKTVPVSLHILNNDMELQGSGGFSGQGFYILDLDQFNPNSTVAASNSLINQDSVVAANNIIFGGNNSAYAPVALVAGISRCSITGNTLYNESTSKVLYSLMVYARLVQPSTGGDYVSAVAITGNVLRGQPILPYRNLNPMPAGPMNTWEFMNSVS